MLVLTNVIIVVNFTKVLVDDHFFHLKGLLPFVICLIYGSLSQVYRQMLLFILLAEQNRSG